MSRVLILGLETSCDETAAAVVADGRVILSNVVNSQMAEHQKFGGVVPEIASRRHLENINLVIDRALAAAGVGFADLAALAVTCGPGLVGALLVGVNTAKTLAFATGKPLVAVHHVVAHVAANYLEHDVAFPAVCLVASGGHTSLLYLRRREEAEVLGTTRDDAAGEAFDKIARTLELGYPGGPAVDSEAAFGNPDAYAFPKAFAGQDGTFDFSFSGLKSAVINTIHNLRQKQEPLNRADVAASFQAAAVAVLVEKTVLAARVKDVKTVLLAGGVAANRELRRRLAEALSADGRSLLCPRPELCTDNAAMVACAGYDLFRQNKFSGFDLNAAPALGIFRQVG